MLDLGGSNWERDKEIWRSSVMVAMISLDTWRPERKWMLSARYILIS
jgi:hypothetical protein